MPGYTHLQRAQPILFAHHLLAYDEMWRRDIERLHESLKRIQVSPLGAAALAGTTFPIDPAAVAESSVFPGSSETAWTQSATGIFSWNLPPMPVSSWCI